jgi:predicted metal-binding membrane protein
MNGGRELPAPRAGLAGSRCCGAGHRAGTGPAVTLAAVLGLAAACWVAAAWRMHGMDMGAATRLGPFPFFVSAWLVMMPAMMLPGAAPALARHAQAAGLRATPLFTGSYLAVWALAGVVVYGTYRPHGALAAGAVTAVAGVYELTPLKRRLRVRCQGGTSSGIRFGLCCAGSSAGLMAVLVALGVMSLGWMAVTTVLASAQKLLPPRAALDVPLALAITGLGIGIMS